MNAARTIRERNQNATIALLLEAGFVADGRTRIEYVRIPTTANPVTGGIGGISTQFGGRLRFSKPGTNLKATVGKLTTNFYTVADGKVTMVATVKTSEIDRVELFAKGDGT